MNTTTSSAKLEEPLSYRRLDWHDFGVTYINFDHGDKPEHAHSTLQVSIPLKRASLVAKVQSASGHKQTKALVEGDICIIRSWQPHTILWERKSEWVSFHLEPAFIERAAHDLRVDGEVRITEGFGVRDKIIQSLGSALQTEFRHAATPSRLCIESLANVLAVHLLRQYSSFNRSVRQATGTLPPCKLQRALEYMNEHLDSELTLAEVAASVNLSPYYFARTFKQTTGFSPHAYVIEQRINRAKRLLTATALPITEVALSVGCRSQSQLTTLFRRHTGTTPKAYRNERSTSSPRAASPLHRTM